MVYALHHCSSYIRIFNSLFSFIGYAAIPAGGGGTFLGGYLVKKFDLHVKGIIRLCLGLTSTVLFLGLVFLVHCQNNPFAGVNLEYGSSADDRYIHELISLFFILNK